MVKVSIVVPVYNVDRYLKECMDSLVNQTLEDIEMVCVNDGSTDRSLDILREYAKNDTRVKVINKANSGYGHTMNVGIDAAEGEYIGIVEPDDYVLPGMYQRLYGIAKELDLDIIKADFYRFSGAGSAKKIEYHHLTKEAGCYRKVLDPKEHIEIFKFIMNTWTGIYKRDFLEKYKIRHNETPGASFQDNGFWFQTFCWAKRVYFLDEPFYMYRKDNPASSVHSREKVYCACEEYEYIHEFLDQNPELKKRYIYMYSLKRFHNYQFTLNRIGREYHKEFLERFSRDFKQAQAEGELSREYFPLTDWKILQMIMESPHKYRIKSQRRASVWYKVHYYLENYGFKKTVQKIVETAAEGWRHDKGIRHRSGL